MSLDFYKIVTERTNTKGVVEVVPKFVVKKSKDLMIRGRDFYAVWNPDINMWSRDEDDVIQMVDNDISDYLNTAQLDPKLTYIPKYMWDSSSGSINAWHHYVQRQCRDNYHNLDEKILFANDEPKKDDYASHMLSYPLAEGETPAWDELMGTLYLPSELAKIEWAIGAIVTGASKKIQKFIVLYGSHGTGKSTLINIIQEMFDGYYTVFEASAVGSSNASFALEPFNANPLIGIQHDGDLSRIEDNTRLNSIVSHEEMLVNEKFKSTYSQKINAFLIMGTNKPVKITDAKSGVIRRLIDIYPSGNKVDLRTWKKLNKQIRTELGAIAYKCQQIYLSDPERYDSYIPVGMMEETNDFYNFVRDCCLELSEQPGVTLNKAWTAYKRYVEDSNMKFPYSRRIFRFELANYFDHYIEDGEVEGVGRVRDWYYGFNMEKTTKSKQLRKDEQDDTLSKTRQSNLEKDGHSQTDDKRHTSETSETDCESKVSSGEGAESYVSREHRTYTLWSELRKQPSRLDDELAMCPAVYATSSGTPRDEWQNISTHLFELRTQRLHYVRVQPNHVVIDFDLRDEQGNKCLLRNIEAARAWPPTYAEISKSGQGLHLHYICNGDLSNVASIVADGIEVKIFRGNSSLRRKLTLCNDLPIAEIDISQLPQKGDKRVVNFQTIANEKAIRTCIMKALRREVHANTTPNICYIDMVLKKAYDQGLVYDVSDLHETVRDFAAGSSHQAGKCLAIVSTMKWKSDEELDNAEWEDVSPITIFDIEVFPNLFTVCYKFHGMDKVFTLINPTAEEVKELYCKYRLVGFNNRRYDNHIIYAWGEEIIRTSEQAYKMSQKIINAPKGSRSDGLLREAYNISYTDIYDFASAGNKMSLKKWEIALGIHHQECPYRWDESVPEDKWDEVADYCQNDVRATEAVFDHLQGDWTARQILADLADMTVNDTTNTLTTRIIFGKRKNPQSEFCWRDMSKPATSLDPEVVAFLQESFPEMMTHKWPEESLLPFWPDYKYDHGKSTWKGEVVGEGGRVTAEHGIHYNVALLDVASMHPHSLEAECYFGPRYTKRFKQIVDGRIDIKHEDWDAIEHILDGKLVKWVDKIKKGEMTSKELANALKTAINSVYGQTAATYSNAMLSEENVDNIVAKRGALFMCVLQEEVEKRGFTVAHIKTDSIKIPDATPEIIKFVMDFGKLYGYSFEHEATYEKMCLVNNAVYIARYATPEWCEKTYGYIPDDCKKHGGEWTATGAQFAEPYVYKTLFTGELIENNDICVTVASSAGALYLDMNEGKPDDTKLQAERVKLIKKGEPVPDELNATINQSHAYVFVGRVGLFCPMKPGAGGGVLLRENSKGVKGKEPYAAVAGSTGYRFLETEVVERMNWWDQVDISYFEKLAQDARDQINKYGRYDIFVR